MIKFQGHQLRQRPFRSSSRTTETNACFWLPLKGAINRTPQRFGIRLYPLLCRWIALILLFKPKYRKIEPRVKAEIRELGFEEYPIQVSTLNSDRLRSG